MTEITLPKLSMAEENELALVDCCRNIHYNFLELGGLLVQNQDCCFWSANRHESFRELVEMLGISYSFGTRLMGLSRLVASQLLSKEEVVQIGVSKACLLLPLASRGKLDDDTKELAKSCPYRDLRIAIGHNVETELTDEYLLCPRCGADVSFNKGMIRRR